MNMARHGYVHTASAWKEFLRGKFDDARLEDLAVPCSVVAVELASGRRVVFDSGNIVDAVMASTAIPGVFPPYRIGDGLYVDGGVLEYMPIPTLLERNVRTIYALDCSYFSIGRTSPASIVDRCSRISSSRSVEQAIALATARGCEVHLLRPEVPEISDGRSLDRTEDFLRAGYDHARRFLHSESNPLESVLSHGTALAASYFPAENAG
jgi:NTE family protein